MIAAERKGVTAVEPVELGRTSFIAWAYDYHFASLSADVNEIILVLGVNKVFDKYKHRSLRRLGLARVFSPFKVINCSPLPTAANRPS
jgi:hypothetical protein